MNVGAVRAKANRHLFWKRRPLPPSFSSDSSVASSSSRWLDGSDGVEARPGSFPSPSPLTASGPVRPIRRAKPGRQQPHMNRCIDRAFGRVIKWCCTREGHASVMSSRVIHEYASCHVTSCHGTPEERGCKSGGNRLLLECLSGAGAAGMCAGAWRVDSPVGTLSRAAGTDLDHRTHPRPLTDEIYIRWHPWILRATIIGAQRDSSEISPSPLIANIGLRGMRMQHKGDEWMSEIIGDTQPTPTPIPIFAHRHQPSTARIHRPAYSNRASRRVGGKVGGARGWNVDRQDGSDWPLVSQAAPLRCLSRHLRPAPSSPGGSHDGQEHLHICRREAPRKASQSRLKR